MVLLILNNTIALHYRSPLEKNPQIQPVILFQQIQLCCVCDVKDGHGKNKKRKWE